MKLDWILNQKKIVILDNFRQLEKFEYTLPSR